MLTRERVEALYDLHLQELREQHNGKSIDLKTAAAEVGLDPRTLQGMRNFPMIRIGRTYRVRLDSLAKWMAERETRQVSQK